jgi:purine-binding chemotaxis protein CheW
VSDSDPTAPAAAGGEPDTVQAVGLMRIGGSVLALPVSQIREVIPRPPAIASLPAKADGLMGAVTVRGMVIAVLDLRACFGMPAAGDGGVIVIMRWQRRLVGLLADDVCGLASTAAGELKPLAPEVQTAASRLVTHSLQWGEDIVSLLDAAAIAALPGIPMVEDSALRRDSGPVAERVPMLLFTVAGYDLAVPAVAVDATIPRSRIEDSAMVAGPCLGVVDHHGLEVPVIDTLAALSLGSAAPRDQSAVLVMRYPHGQRLGFVMDEVRDILRIAPEQVRPLPDLSTADPSLVSGVLRDETGRPHLVLHPEGLQGRQGLATFAGLSRRRSDGPAGNVAATRLGDSSRGAEPFLVYKAGPTVATRLSQILEILPFPSTVITLPLRPDGLFGIVTHRDHSVPLVCLTTRLGRVRSQPREAGRILLVGSGGTVLGFLVEDLVAVESSRLTTSRHRSNALDPSLGSMIEIGAAGAREFVPHVDLADHIAHIASEAAGPDALAALVA